MITEKQIIIPAVPEKTITKKIFICDLCGDECHGAVCKICKRMVCKSYTKSCSTYDPWNDGDYPDPVCSICYKLIKNKYDKEREDMFERHYKDEEDLEQRLREESLANDSKG